MKTASTVAWGAVVGVAIKRLGSVTDTRKNVSVIVGANPLNVTSAGNYDTLGRRYDVGLAVTF